MGVEDLPSDAPRPRLCHLVKRADFAGYGFNLHAEKARPGQYIGTVDPDSPADLAGLKEGDRIVEVNGVNINQGSRRRLFTLRLDAKPSLNFGASLELGVRVCLSFPYNRESRKC